jgi:hypothetical protein
MNTEWVSIRSINELGIQKQVKQKYFGDKQAAKLKYSHNTEEIGITPVHIDDKNSFTINGESAKIRCKLFLDEFSLTRDEATKHPITVEDGTIWVDTTTILARGEYPQSDTD